MKNEGEKNRARSRPRKKVAPPSPAAPIPPAPVQVGSKNVGSLESGFSLLLGVLFVVAALFPRSIKQLFLLGAGTSLVYRGMTSHCAVYEALGFDTDKGSLAGQISEKVQAAKQG
jgi:uncharacterized membrane protein